MSEPTKRPDLSELQPLIDAGLQLIPLHRWDAIDAKGKPAGKRPRDKQWLGLTYRDEEMLAWSKRTGGNLGMRPRDGELILDADPRNYPEGRDCLREFCEKVGIDLRLYPVVRTGSGGFHVYTRIPPGARVRKSLPEFPGLDFISVGGQVVAPGSIHPNGNYYRWDALELPDLRTLPELLAAALEAIARPLPNSSTTKRATMGMGAAESTDSEGPIELGDALACLKQLKVENYGGRANYQRWLQLAMAFHAATGGSLEGREAFVTWSIVDPIYAQDSDEIRNKWDGFTADKLGGVTTGTLFWHVLEADGELPAEKIPEDLFEVFEEAAPEKPIIVLTGRQLDELAKQIAVAVANANAPPTLFRQGGEVVRTFRSEKGELVIRPQISQRFLHVASSVAKYYVRESKVLKPAKQIGQVANLALEELTLGEYLPPLRGIVTHPILRPDGSILARSGYDQTIEVYADLRAEVEIDVPGCPTGQEIRAARELILEPFADFPFGDEASRANAVAIIVTLLTRELFDLAPLFAISAPTAGSGKGLLTRVVTQIPRGVDPALMSQPRDEDEWRKRIFSILRSGRDLCVIDNVRGVLDSASLLGLLTSTKWEDRILGASAQVALDNRTTWIATGNNLPIRGSEMLRRTVWVTINPECARPDKRSEFRHPNLPQWVMENRGRLLAAAFTLCRAWIIEGRPVASAARMGSFEQWQIVVGGILDVAGIPGFMANADAAFEELEEEGAQWGSFLLAWKRKQRSNPIESRDLAKLIEADTDLRKALPDGLSPDDLKFVDILGTALRDRVDRRFPAPDGGEIWIQKKTSKPRARWLVSQSQM